MKSRKQSRLLLIPAVLLISNCAISSKLAVVPSSEPISGDKAYLACVYYYLDLHPGDMGSADKYSPFLRLQSDNAEPVYIKFPENQKPELLVVEVEPGEYTVKEIVKVEQVGRMPNRLYLNIPPNEQLNGKLAVEQGSIIYLGDFSMFRDVHYITQFSYSPAFAMRYDYDLHGFRDRLEQEYYVPEIIEISGL